MVMLVYVSQRYNVLVQNFNFTVSSGENF